MDILKLQSQAEAGSAFAQGVLGLSYLYGVDTPKDYTLARRWLEVAADGAQSWPTFHLARMHEEGWGVPVDYRKAISFYLRAAECGEWIALIHLARMYRYGRGTKVDEAAACKWYRAALSASESTWLCIELEEAQEFLCSHEHAA